MSRRRTKTPLYSGVDRISELPDPILVHILSLLPIKQAIRTEFLSTRWKSLWTCIPTLIFREFSCGPDCLAQNSDGDIDYDYDEEKCSRFEEGKFVTFVDKTLSLSNCSRVKKLGVSFGYKPSFASNVDSWSQFAAGKGTEEVHFEFHDGEYPLDKKDHYELPQHLYTNSSFRELRFVRCRVSPKGDIGWRSLGKLSIGDVKLSDDLVQKILSGCPALEMLELYRYDGFSRLNIDNASLKKLILRKFVGRTYEEDEAYGEDDPEVDVDDADGEDNPQVDDADGEDNPQVDEANGEDDPQVDEADGPEADEADGEDDPEVADWQHGPEEDEADGEHDRVGLVISAPYLQTMEISGCAPRNCRLLDLSSLVYAKLACKLISDGGDVEDFERIQAEFRGLLSSFVHLKSLAVGEWALQVLPIMEAKGLTSPLLNCTSLTLETCLTNDVFPGVASMLGISPNLETLVITKFFPSGGTQYYWIQQAKLCNFKEEHYWTSQKRIFKCLSLHLKNVVFADSSWLHMYGCESNFFDLVQFLLKNAKVLQKIIINTSRLEDVMPKEFFRAAKKILSFPRSSPEAVVLFS